jgi:hypothetical protein
MLYSASTPVEPTAAGRRELAAVVPRLACPVASGRVRVDALEEMLSCGVRKEMS